MDGRADISEARSISLLSTEDAREVAATCGISDWDSRATLPATVIIDSCPTMLIPQNIHGDEPPVPQNQEQPLVSMCVDAFRSISRH